MSAVMMNCWAVALGSRVGWEPGTLGWRGRGADALRERGCNATVHTTVRWTWAGRSAAAATAPVEYDVPPSAPRANKCGGRPNCVSLFLTISFSKFF